MELDKGLIDLALTYNFIQLWFQWNELTLSALSRRDKIPYGYRAGVFYPHGARDGQHHDDWPTFFNAMAVLGVSYTGIHALFCYQRYPSCKAFLDSGGTTPI